MTTTKPTKLWRRIAVWDRRVSRAIANRRARRWTWPLVVFSWSGATLVWFSVAGALLWARHRGVELIPRQSLFLASMLASLAALVVGTVIKRLVKRPRPFAETRQESAEDTPIAAAVWAPGRAHSFPSTHSSTSAALATALLVGGHPFGPYVAAWSIVTAWSRIYLGVHYPSDVLTGLAIGITMGLFDWSRLL